MKKLMLLTILLAGIMQGCMKPTIESDMPSRKAQKLAMVKFLLSPDWTMVEYEKEIRYQQYLERQRLEK